MNDDTEPLTAEELDTLAKLLEDAYDGEIRSYRTSVLNSLSVKIAAMRLEQEQA